MHGTTEIRTMPFYGYQGLEEGRVVPTLPARPSQCPEGTPLPIAPPPLSNPEPRRIVLRGVEMDDLYPVDRRQQAASLLYYYSGKGMVLTATLQGTGVRTIEEGCKVIAYLTLYYTRANLQVTPNLSLSSFEQAGHR